MAAISTAVDADRSHRPRQGRTWHSGAERICSGGSPEGQEIAGRARAKTSAGVRTPRTFRGRRWSRSPLPAPGPPSLGGSQPLLESTGVPSRWCTRSRHHSLRQPLATHHRLWTPAFLPPDLSGHGGGFLAMDRGLAVGLWVPITPLATMARGLPRDRTGVASRIAGDLSCRPSPMQPRVNRASFVMGPAIVAYGYDHPPLVIN